MSVVCIILARGGSKGLPGKNISKLNDIPLIAHTIRQAKKSKMIDDVVVSTDCDKIKEISKQEKALVPFVRPKEISQDRSTTESGLQHALKWLDINHNVYDIVLYLDCCQPFRKVEWIDTCIQKLKDDPSLESVFVGKRLYKNIWTSDQKKLYWENYSSRQERSYVIEEKTGVCCATRSSIVRQGKRIGNNVFIVEVEETGPDIHTLADLEMANHYMNLTCL